MTATRPNRPFRFATRAIHHAYDATEHQGAVAPPVCFTSTYTYPTIKDTGAAAAQGGLLYAREHNPTTEILEARLANLEGAEAGVVVATGMAAVGTLLLSLLSQGDEATLAPGVAEDLIRLSIGLEDVDDLVDDLRGALSSL